MSIPIHKDMTEEEQLTLMETNGGSVMVDIIDAGIIPSEAVQLAAVNSHWYILDVLLKNKIIPSEVVQLEAVKRNGYTISYVLKAGIIPSEAVQLAAINNAHAMFYILDMNIIPSEEVQLAAVYTNKYSLPELIKYGITPSQEVKNVHYIRWVL